MWVNRVTVQLGEPVQNPAGFVQGLVQWGTQDSLLWPGQCPRRVPCLPCRWSTAPLPALPSMPVFRPLRCPPPHSHACFFCPEVTKLPVIPLCQFFPNPAVVLGNIYLPAASSAAAALRPVPTYLSLCYLRPSGMFTFAPLDLFPLKPGFIKSHEPRRMLSGYCRNALWTMFGLWRESCTLVRDVNPPGVGAARTALQHCPELSQAVGCCSCVEELFLPCWKPQADFDLSGLSFRWWEIEGAAQERVFPVELQGQPGGIG